jgi:ribose transport system ATP-binding protein
MASPEALLLSVRHLEKSFAGTHALDDVSIDFAAGEVHALLGENGAGKSTLIKILAGVYHADGGQVLWRGKPIRPEDDHPPIAFIHQDLGLVDQMTVAENIALVAGYPRRGRLIDWRGADRLAAELLERLGGGISPQTRVGDLSAAAKSIVAITRALAIQADLVVLDEPTAALPEADVARLVDALRRLRAQGIGVVYVTHRLDEVFRVADRVTVLRDGRKILTSALADLKLQQVVEAIVGRRLEERSTELPPPRAGVLLHVEDIVAGGAGPVSFAVAEGEVLGLVGLRGAGHDTVGRAIFGDVPLDAGRVTLRGEAIDLSGPGASTAHGLGFVSSKRREESLAPSLTVRENLYMNPLLVGAGLFRPIVRSAERAQATDVLRRLSMRPADPERPILTLSGGNQQKAVVSRWIEARCRVLILEEPTIGVDVGSKAEIYDLLLAAQAEGLAVLLISSDFEEVARICHRALVFDRGRPAVELDRGDLSVDSLTRAASREMGSAAQH